MSAQKRTNRISAVHLGLCALVAACGGGEPESHLPQRDDATGGQALAALRFEETKTLGEAEPLVAENDSINRNNTYLQPPFVYRNSLQFNLQYVEHRYVELVVATYPAQPYAPVYTWRTHWQGFGPGPHGYNGDLAGFTNQYGVFEMAGYLPFDRSLCGWYTDETFAVGSIYGPRSSPLSFQIYVSPDVGPPAPGCRP
jgi:hypothetical protein